MSRFYRNLILILLVIGLIIFLLFRFLVNYTDTMNNVHQPDNYEEEGGESDTGTYIPSNPNE